MKFSLTTLTHLFLDPSRREELLGDLEELRERRSSKLGIAKADRRYAADLVSICCRQSRLRAWTLNEWTRTAGIVWLLAFGFLAMKPSAESASRLYTISATDAAGTFTLEMDRHRVLSATIDGVPLPSYRIVQNENQLTLKQGNGDRDLTIRITGEGAIQWEGRESSLTDSNPMPEQSHET